MRVWGRRMINPPIWRVFLYTCFMSSLYLLSKKIHRITMFIAVVLILLMTFTGTFMKFPFLLKYVGFLNVIQLRQLHSTFSPYFSLTILVMLVTGVFMYLYPYLIKKEGLTKTQNKNINYNPKKKT